MAIKLTFLRRIHFLYFFGFCANFRPTDPFLYKFFIVHNNLTEDKVSHNVLPVLTYSCLFHFALIFLLSGLYCFKALIIVSTIFAAISTSIRIWGTTLAETVISEILRGTSEATEIGYYIYVYSYHDLATYQRATAYTRISALLGKVMSAIFVQQFLDKKWTSFEKIEYVHLVAIGLAAISGFLIPTPKENVYQMSEPVAAHKDLSEKIKEHLLNMKMKFFEVFTQTYIKRWSFWFVWSIWSYNQISIFIQPLWETLHNSFYNGLVEATLAIFSFFAVTVAGFKSINWEKRTIIIMPLLTGFQYILFLSGIAFSNGYILFNYISYVCFGGIHYFVVTAIAAEIARNQQRNCFGLVFSFLYMCAYFFNTIIVMIVNDRIAVYKFTPHEQFFVYFTVFVVIYVIFFMSLEIKKRIQTLMARR